MIRALVLALTGCDTSPLITETIVCHAEDWCAGIHVHLTDTQCLETEGDGDQVASGFAQEMIDGCNMITAGCATRLCTSTCVDTHVECTPPPDDAE